MILDPMALRRQISLGLPLFEVLSLFLHGIWPISSIFRDSYKILTRDLGSLKRTMHTGILGYTL